MARDSRIIVTIVWLLFVGIFLSLYYQHASEAKKSISDLRMTRQFDTTPSTRSWVDSQQPLANFVRDFNDYLKKYNESSRAANQLAACGYFVAALTALFSAILTWWDDLPKGIRVGKDALTQWVARRLYGHA
jgi:hypothetical protein